MEKRLRTVAMYLPQFHRVKENDEWWGEGFTEWTTVNSSQKLFENHNQPRVPLNQNYYDLLKKETMQWQADLAHQYGIDGFCFYHYYFKDGRKILETPAENLLEWKEINMPFCMCWANETWARTWTNIAGANSWSERFESKDKNGNGILLEQDYGGLEQWKAHFDYLSLFFEDTRYIKIDNKPVFLIYKPADIYEIDKMIEYWNQEAKNKGFKGMYIIVVNNMRDIPGVSATLLQGPLAFYSSYIAGMKVQPKYLNGVCTYDYQECYNNALKCEVKSNNPVFFGGFVDYDDTPRRGKAGTYLEGACPSVFEDNLYKLAVKNIMHGNKFLFINAWNEWGEGNYLEPDEKYAYQYLEAVKRVMEKCNGEAFDINSARDTYCIKNESEVRDEVLSDLYKYKELYALLIQWLSLKERGININSYFEKKEYNRIMIYGIAALGKHLYRDIKTNSQLEIVGAIDRRQGIKLDDTPIYKPDSELPECDVIVVTAALDYYDIKRELEHKTAAQIVSLREVLFEC